MGAEALIIFGMIVGVAYCLCGFSATSDAMTADEANWSTVEDLVLPVNVTRTILPGYTQFHYWARGDEYAVFFECNGYGQQTTVFTISHEILSPMQFEPPFYVWPSATLTVIRATGTTEKYSLPTRGGPVRGYT